MRWDVVDEEAKLLIIIAIDSGECNGQRKISKAAVENDEKR